MRLRWTSLCSIPAMLLALVALAGPVAANDVVYPPGSRIGLVPLQGIVPLKSGAGFENPETNLIVSLRELAPSAFDAIDTAVKERKPLPYALGDAQAFDTAAGKAYLSRAGGPNSGPKNNRISIIVSNGKIAGFIAVDVPEAAAQTYSDQAIRTMLASTTLRSEVPVEEQLSLLPFKVSELSGFSNVKTLVPGLAVMLLEGDEEDALAGSPYVLITVARVSADEQHEREKIARQLASTIPGIRDGRIINSESMRIGGTPGHELRVEAVTQKGDKPVTIVQWLRFGGGATLRIVAASSREDWPQNFTRFRAVRDGIDRR